MSTEKKNVLILGQDEKNRTASQIVGDKYAAKFYENDRIKKLSDVSKPVGESDGFVLLPGADPFLSVSTIVDKQGEQRLMGEGKKGKPIVVYEKDGKPSPIVQMLSDLHQAGMFPEKPEQMVSVARKEEEIPVLLNKGLHEMSKPEQLKDPGKKNEFHKGVQEYADNLNAESDAKRHHPFSVCVFCSASTKDPEYLALSHRVGQAITKNGWEFVNGGSNNSMMGQAAEGAKSIEGGYSTGVTTPVYAQKELLTLNKRPAIDELKITDTIFERMEEMFTSDALIVLPGGAGTAQEALAKAFSMKNDPSLKDKPTLVYNKDGFWDGLKGMLEESGQGDAFQFVSSEKELFTALKQNFAGKEIRDRREEKSEKSGKDLSPALKKRNQGRG